MEVMVRNLQHAMTERQTKKFFEPHLNNLGIFTFRVEKHQNKPFALLTFIDTTVGNRFLEIHGQIQPGGQGFSRVKVKLYHLGRPVNCSKSYNIPDRFVISSLASQELRRLARVHIKGLHPPVLEHSINAQRTFLIKTLSCGQWGYSDRKPVFRSHFQTFVQGRILYGRGAVVLKLNLPGIEAPEKQLIIRYDSIESTVTGDIERNNPSISFSLAEAPRLYEKTSAPTKEELLAQDFLTLTLQRPGSRTPYNPVKRKRISALNKAHGKVVASCLCYRVTLTDHRDMRAVKALNRIQEIPSSVAYNTTVEFDPTHAFPVQMTKLNNALTGGKYAQFSFGAKFQLQRLAQNGYLPPSRVVDLMDAVSKLTTETSWPVMTKAIQRLSEQIPYAGPATDASELSLQTLSDQLRENIASIVKEQSYSKGLSEQPEHIAQVFKAIVTPTGIYLYGPEPEMKNRVLRKYSSHTDYFLQVRFSDENSEQIWYERVTSQEEIYHGRFKGVLHGNINIAGRGFEVRFRSIKVVLQAGYFPPASLLACRMVIL